MRDRLSARIAIAFAVVGLAVLVATGAGLFVVLRGLHQSATEATLGDIAQPIVARLPRTTSLVELRAAAASIRAELPAGAGIYLVLPGGRWVGEGDPQLDISAVAVDDRLARGETASGTLTAAGGARHLYTATVIREGLVGPTAVVLTLPDRSGAQAVGDVLRVLPFVILMVLLICVPVGWLLVRSVTRPIGRLAAATSDLAGRRAATLPLSGPQEIRELTARFNAMTAALEAARREEAELLANVRHDLRTPVTVIGGFAQALTDGTATGPAADRAAAAIAQEADRLARLIEGLGTLDEHGPGRAALKPESLDPTAIVEEAVARFAPTAAPLGVTVSVGPASADTTRGVAPTRPERFLADRQAVERMLGNLVANALASVSRPGGHVVVNAGSTRLPDGRDAVALSVGDDGPGFPPGALDRAFDRFYRGDPSRSGSGSGLGLAIVRALARAHGGDATAENLAPTGARVTIVLPLVPSPPAPAA